MNVWRALGAALMLPRPVVLAIVAMVSLLVLGALSAILLALSVALYVLAKVLEAL